jgi:pimeloyl-ACP methyl ester carboxylesterase
MVNAVICSHGFGVRADSRGMFPEIAAAFPESQFKMFDYNEVLPNGDTIVASLDRQAEILNEQISSVQNSEVIVLAHSQGCVVAGLADLSRVSKVVLLAPPVNESMQGLIDRIAARPGAVYDPNGISILPRSDGTTSYLPKEYIHSRQIQKPFELYQKIADTVPTVIIRATADEIIGLTNVNEIKNAQHIDIDADHNFQGESRKLLLRALKTVLV